MEGARGRAAGPGSVRRAAAAGSPRRPRRRWWRGRGGSRAGSPRPLQGAS